MTYLVGVEMQVDRFKESYAYLMANKSEIRTNSVLMHEFSCLVEDLNMIRVFMMDRGFAHANHDLYKQARHHVRHDLLDPNPAPNEVKKTAERAKELGFDEGFESMITWHKEGVMVGNRMINFEEALAYADWAKEVLGQRGAS
jgi:hypothetical protein